MPIPIRALAGGLALSLALAAVSAAAPPAEKKKGGGETFIQLPSVTATLLRGAGERGVLTVDVGVDVPDARLRRRAELAVPLLRDAFAQTLATYAPGLPSGAPPNPDAIGAALQAACDRTLGARGAVVLLGTIMVN